MQKCQDAIAIVEEVVVVIVKESIVTVIHHRHLLLQSQIMKQNIQHLLDQVVKIH